ncbi:hypothetical protein ACH3XW_42625 [Acanthocheilonema viteae]|uniref:Uncharacterized protein n=1 Tax=Acanthocheilonema viteae TaxID=6277 RepID=A0A498SG62_ACAVI|nr:unnamed protein product [Acanthocheilonema viteae]
MMMAYSPEQPSLPVHSSDLLQSSNSHTAFTNSLAFKPTDEPIYYYTIAKGDVENLSISSLYDSRENSRLCAHRCYDDVQVDRCRHNSFLKRDISTPKMKSPLSRESDAYRPDSSVYQNCYCQCSINRLQNLTTTFQSQPNDVWQTRKYYCEEKVVIVLRDEVERVGFSIGGIIPGNHGAAINSVLPGMAL